MKYGGLTSLRTRQSGMSLVELMVGLALGLLLMAGVMQVFLSSKQTYRFQDAQSQIQENGRFAMDTLESRLRMAGYAGCYGDFSSGVENMLNNPANFAWNISNPVQGFDNVAATDNLGGITGFIAGSDVLVIRGMSNGVLVNSNPDNLEFTVTAANNRFAPGEILLVTDCDQASLFQATAVTTASGVTTIKHTAGGGMTPGNSAGNVDNSYGNEAEIGHLQTWMYYLKKSDDNDRPALLVSSLVSDGTTVSLDSQELVQNVENLQFVFGVDTDSDRDTDVYQEAAAVTNWGNVVSVRIALLFDSEADNLLSDKQSYSFNATTFFYDRDSTPAADANRRFRRVFIGFAALRNRTL